MAQLSDGNVGDNARQGARPNVRPSVVYVKVSDELRLIRDRWYTLDEVCGMLRVANSTVRRWLADGELIGYRLGGNGPVRIQGSAIMAFLTPCKKRVVKVAKVEQKPAQRPIKFRLGPIIPRFPEPRR